MAERIVNDMELFRKFVPALDANFDVNGLESFIEESECRMRDEILGDGLYSHIKDLPEDSDALRVARAAVCLKAYETAIPFLDLVQTGNGFAVVRNQSQAPASKERVERLLDTLRRRLTSALDRLWTLCLKDDALRERWKQADALFLGHTGIVYLTTAELRTFAKNDALLYTDLQAIRPEVAALQSRLANTLSQDYLNALLDRRRNNALSPFDKNVFSAVQSIIGLWLQKADGHEAHGMKEKLINYMEANPEEFPEYIHSQEYRLKTAGKYENQKEDPVFFFG